MGKNTNWADVCSHKNELQMLQQKFCRQNDFLHLKRSNSPVLTVLGKTVSSSLKSLYFQLKFFVIIAKVF